MVKKHGGARPGAGRPGSNYTERITIEVTQDMKREIEEARTIKGRPRNEVLRNFLAKQLKEEKKKNMQQTLEKFLASPDFESGVISSTRASWDGASYSVELFPDGTWRVLWTSKIGDLYESPGVILSLPALDDEDMAEYCQDYSEDDFFAAQFDLEKEDRASELRDALNDALNS